MLIELADRRRRNERVEFATLVAIGTQSGWTGKRDGLKRLADGLKADTGGTLVREVRDRLAGLYAQLRAKESR